MTSPGVPFLMLIAMLAWPVTLRGDDFVPQIGWNEQLFPSYIISTATMKATPPSEEDATDVLGDKDGLLGIQMTSPGRNVAVKVTVTCDEVMEPSSFSGTFPEKGIEYSVFPRIKYRFGKLAEVDQATPVTVTFRVEVGTGMAHEETATALIRPINDCPFLIQVGDEEMDTSYTFAAYVNEQHPYLDKVLREALDNGIVDSFTGYQGQDDGAVILQVYALWDALVARDVRYSSITTTSVESDSVASQHVRLIDQSLNNSQANCVDGSVLFASLLRKVGIEPFLVMTPGHCYLGFSLDEKQERLLAIETTMLGDATEDDGSHESLDLLETAVEEDLRNESSWFSFSNALAAATADLEENDEKFASEDEPDYMIINIAEARRNGILPIAFRGKEKFIGNGQNAAGSTEDTEQEE